MSGIKQSIWVIIIISGLIIAGLSYILIFLFSSFPGAANLILSTNAVYPTEKSKYVVGQTFSQEDVDRFINISSNDYFVQQDVLGGLNSSAKIGCVTAAQYLERAPGGIPSSWLNPPVYRVLPVIVYYYGDPSYEGYNVSAFIDPDKGYVPYIGYTVRNGIEGDYIFTTTANGVDEVNKNKDPPAGSIIYVGMENLSIGYSNYIPPDKLTKEQKDELTDIILNDHFVTNSLRGYNYTIDKIHSQTVLKQSGIGYYHTVYPSVYIIDQNTTKPIMEVEADLINKKVVDHRFYVTPRLIDYIF